MQHCFFVPLMQTGAPGMTFRACDNSKGNDNAAKAQRGLSRVLPTMEEEVEQVYCV